MQMLLLVTAVPISATAPNPSGASRTTNSKAADAMGSLLRSHRAGMVSAPLPGSTLFITCPMRISLSIQYIEVVQTCSRAEMGKALQPHPG